MNTGKASSITLSSVALPVLAISAAAAFFFYAAPILIPMTIAAATAYTLVPVVVFLKKFKIPHFLAVMIVMLIMLGIGVVLAFVLISELADLAGDIPKYQQAALEFFDSAKDFIGSQLEQIPGLFPQIKDFKFDPSYFSGAGKVFFKSLGSVTAIGFQGFLLFFLTYFILSDYEMFVDKFKLLFGTDKKVTTSSILDQINKQLRGFISVKVGVTIGMSVVFTVGLLIMKVPYAYIWGPLAGILNLIPYVGAIIGAIPPIAIAGITKGSMGAMIPVALLFLIVQIFESNLITPKLTSDSVDLNPLAVLVASIIWGYLWGAIGVILAVPITAAVKVVCDNVESLEPIGVLLGGRGR
ncbi:MAG: AI-2E family transporter [candidate division Zixibacteria bacterium]|nr:AI-2E family transporter [candidate division Zixibacteria bacterium]